MATRKKKSSTSSTRQASLPLGSSKKRVAVAGYTRTFSAAKLPPRAKNGKWRKKR